MLQPMRNVIERISPRHLLEPTAGDTDHRMQQAALKPKRFAKRRALGTETTEI
jgi:hypothetical protein